MLRNYAKITFRSLWKNRVYSGINVFGLAVGLATCLLITLYVADELSYDRFHQRATGSTGWCIVSGGSSP